MTYKDKLLKQKPIPLERPKIYISDANSLENRKKASYSHGLDAIFRPQHLLFVLPLMAPGRGPGESFSRQHCSASCPLSIPASSILIWVNNLGLDFSLSCFYLTRIQYNSLPTNLFSFHCTVYMIGPSHSVSFLPNFDTLHSCTLLVLSLIVTSSPLKVPVLLQFQETAHFLMPLISDTRYTKYSAHSLMPSKASRNGSS